MTLQGNPCVHLHMLPLTSTTFCWMLLSEQMLGSSSSFVGADAVTLL